MEVLLGRRCKDELKFWTFDGLRNPKKVWSTILNDSSITEFTHDEELASYTLVRKTTPPFEN